MDGRPQGEIENAAPQLLVLEVPDLSDYDMAPVPSPERTVFESKLPLIASLGVLGAAQELYNRGVLPEDPEKLMRLGAPLVSGTCARRTKQFEEIGVISADSPSYQALVSPSQHQCAGSEEEVKEAVESLAGGYMLARLLTDCLQQEASGADIQKQNLAIPGSVIRRFSGVEVIDFDPTDPAVTAA